MSLVPRQPDHLDGLHVYEEVGGVVVLVEQGSPLYAVLEDMAELLDLQLEDILALLVEDWRAVWLRSRYVEGLTEVEELWRMLARAMLARASTAELAALLERLHAAQETQAALYRVVPVARHPRIVELFRNLETGAALAWPEPPRRPRAGIGGRKRLEDSPDMTWIQQLTRAYQIRGETGLPWDQIAARIGISERQLTEHRRRAELLED